MILTKVIVGNNLNRMGRKKKGYRAPEGLVRMPGSPYWWIVIGKIRKSTKIPLSDITKATILLREVQKRLLEKRAQAEEILGESISFSQLIRRYLVEVSSTKRSERADRTNAQHPLKFFGEQRIDTIKPQDIYRYQDWRKSFPGRYGKPISGATINRERALISHAMKWAIRWGYIEKNPVTGTEGFKENKRDRYITDEEFEAIKNVARSIPEAAHLPEIMDALYYTVQRSGKIFDLRWSQINLDERKITFKGDSETKKVPNEIWINQPLFELLLRLKAQRSLQKVVGPYVFQKRDGKPYKSVRKTWSNCCRKAGVLDARVHDIRHKAITDMGRKGYSLQEIAKAAGHSQISTTMRYTHLRAEDTREALESLGEK
jgi:integrase